MPRFWVTILAGLPRRRAVDRLRPVRSQLPAAARRRTGDATRDVRPSHSPLFSVPLCLAWCVPSPPPRTATIAPDAHAPARPPARRRRRPGRQRAGRADDAAAGDRRAARPRADRLVRRHPDAARLPRLLRPPGPDRAEPALPRRRAAEHADRPALRAGPLLPALPRGRPVPRTTRPRRPSATRRPVGSSPRSSTGCRRCGRRSPPTSPPRSTATRRRTARTRRSSAIRGCTPSPSTASPTSCTRWACPCCPA